MNDEARRFWSKVEKTPTCWLWTAGRFHDGAGAFGVGGRAVHAHRWAYEHSVGPIPAGLELGHVCLVQLCVRPAHLKPVTHRANASRGVVVRRHAAHEREADTAADCLARLPDARRATMPARRKRFLATTFQKRGGLPSHAEAAPATGKDNQGMKSPLDVDR